MFSKLSAHSRLLAGLSAAIFSVSAFTSCGVNEGPTNTKDKIDSSNIACLSSMRSVLVEYFDGRASASDVRGLEACLNTALDKFLADTRGEVAGRYTARELRNFLQTYFLDFEITDSFLKEIMLLKKNMLGGDTEQFSAVDFQMLRARISVFHDILQDLRPHMPMEMKRFEKMKASNLDRAGDAIVSAASRFANLVASANTKYSISDLDRLLGEIQKQFPEARSLGEFRKHKPLVIRLKKKLIAPGRSGDDVTAKEWKIILNDGARWLNVFLKYQNLDANHSDWTKGTGRDRLVSISKNAFDLIQNVIDRHGGTLTYASINSLLDELPWSNGFLGIDIQLKTIKKVIPPTVQRIFGDTDLSVTGRSAKGLNAKNLGRIESALLEWAESSRFLEGVYTKLSAGRPLRDDSVFSTNQLLSVSSVSGVSSEVAADLRKVMQNYPSFLAGAEKGIRFDGANATRPKSYADLFQHTWLRPIFRRILRGYVSGSDMSARAANFDRYGLTLPEFQKLIADYWPVLLDFNLVGRDNSPELDGSKRFREASLFTFASDGNAQITLDEGAQLLLFMISSQPQANTLHSEAARVCRTGPNDEFGKPTIEPICYRNTVYNFATTNASSRKIWGNFPVFMKYYDTLNSTQREQLAFRLENAARKQLYQEREWFNSSDSDALMMLVHYVETIFLRYDVSPQTGTINYKESLVALETFRNELATVTKFDRNSKRLKSIFTWLLVKGESPISCKMSRLEKAGAGISFYAWHVDGLMSNGWRFESDRNKLYGVLSSICTTAKEEEECSAAAELTSNAPPGARDD